MSFGVIFLQVDMTALRWRILFSFLLILLVHHWFSAPVIYADEILENKTTRVYGYEVIQAYPHDAESFTQGLAFVGGLLYEGTGLYGRSSLRRGGLNGEGQTVRLLPAHLFGEGLTVLGERIFQLTWKSGLGIIWDKKSLKMIGSFFYPNEGWGMTHDNTWLIVSDGSAVLYFLDPATFKLDRRLTITDCGKPVNRLNELEFIKGEIWANVWKDNRIVRINPDSGQVTGWIDLAGLVATVAPREQDSVLNGIAYDSVNDRIFVTGKRWNQLFEIRVK